MKLLITSLIILFVLTLGFVSALEIDSDSIAKTNNETKDFSDDDSNSPIKCEEGYVYSACEKCIKESKAYDINLLTEEIDVKIVKSDNYILNSITKKATFKIYPEIKFRNSDNKTVDYCNIKYHELNGKISGKIITEKPYSGFIDGNISEKRKISKSFEWNLSERKPVITFILSPNDKKKYISNESEIIEKLQFTIQFKKTEKIEDSHIRLVPPEMGLTVSSSGANIKHGETEILFVKVDSSSTPDVMIHFLLLGPGHIGLDSNNLSSRTELVQIRARDELKIGYAAPSVGEFDSFEYIKLFSVLNQDKISSSKIIREKITQDFDYNSCDIEKLVKSGKYSEKMELFTDSFKKSNGLPNIPGVNETLPIISINYENDEEKEDSLKPDFSETYVSGISFEETGIGIIHFISNNLQNNENIKRKADVWNLTNKSIAKSEKTERTKDISYPAVIIITAQDISGWTVQDIYIYRISSERFD